jgi:hypothetical protein
MYNKYPRLLIINLHRVNQSDTDSASFLIRNLFGDWPRNQLAQIYSSQNNGDEGFCGNYYQITHTERRFGRIFFKLKDASGHEHNLLSQRVMRSAYPETNAVVKLKRFLAKFFMRSQVYELIFQIQLSNKLREWVTEYSPDIIYATGYTIGFAKIAIQLADENNVPLCIHWSDDWPNNLLENAPLLLRKTIYSKIIQKLINSASLRWVFSPTMANEYKKRYHHNFQVVMNGDSPYRFDVLPKENSDEMTIVLIGNFLMNRWRSLVNLCDACHELRNNGINIKVLVYYTAIPVEVFGILEDYNFLELKKSPDHDQIPTILKTADLLVIIEPFDKVYASEMRYSISTKAHLFMFAKRPILVYAPEITGIYQYAETTGFASVVGVEDKGLLQDRLRSILIDDSLRTVLVERAWRVVNQNHDIRKIRAYVCEEFQQLAAKQANLNG